MLGTCSVPRERSCETKPIRLRWRERARVGKVSDTAKPKRAKQSQFVRGWGSEVSDLTLGARPMTWACVRNKANLSRRERDGKCFM